MLSRSLYLFVSKVVGYGIRLVLPYVLVRLLDKADFGAYRQFFLLEVIIATIFQFGVNQALYYFIPRDEKNAGAYFLNSILLNLVIFGLALTGISFFAPALSERLQMPVLTDYFPQLATYTLIIMLISSADCYLTARQKIKQSAFFEISGQVIASIATLIAAFTSRQLGTIVTALVLGRLLHLLLMVGYVQFRLRGFVALSYFFNLWPQVRYGLVLGVGGTFWTLLQRLHEVMVSSHYGPETYAVYSAGCTSIPFLNFYIQSLAVVSLGRFAAMDKERDHGGTRELWHKILVGQYAAAIPITLFLLAISKPLVLFIFTHDYAGAINIFRVNTLSQLFLIWNATLVLRAMGRNDVSLYLNLVLLIAAPLLLHLAIVRYGMLGAISTQFVLLLGGRLIATAILNRVSGLKLSYVVSPRELFRFYRQSLVKLRDKLNELRASAGDNGTLNV